MKIVDEFNQLDKNVISHFSKDTKLHDTLIQSGAQQIPLSKIPEDFLKNAQLTCRLMYPVEIKQRGSHFLAYFIPEEKNSDLPFLLIESETGFWTTGSEYFLSLYRAAH